MKLRLDKGFEKVALKLVNFTFRIEIVPKPIFKLMIYKRFGIRYVPQFVLCY